MGRLGEIDLMKYKGMTVNERLYVSGLLESFDKAILRNDREQVIRILRDIEVDDESISKTLSKFKLADGTKDDS